MKKRFSVLAMLFVCPVGLALLAGARGAELNDAQQRSLIGYATCLKCVTSEGGAQCQAPNSNIEAKDAQGQPLYPCDARNPGGTQTFCMDTSQAKNCTANNTPGACAENNHFCIGQITYTCLCELDEYGICNYKWDSGSVKADASCGGSVTWCQ